ncbi:MAG: GTPase domain-containing protein [Rubrivivax sp.]
MAASIALSLVSHTNVGKTTLARTLLARDVGEVRDAPHVTEFAEQQLLLRSEAGDELWLWDTPGFGDTARLLRRLRAGDHPLGWLLSQVWDRWRDRAFWGSQQALRHVRDTSDVVLYLVNAAEPPEAAGYLAPEMELLSWIGKPVLVLLNQLGPPRDAAADAADVERWTGRLRHWPLVRRVLPLDAFARCWVHEGALWAAVHEVLPPARQAAMQALQQAWQAQRQRGFSDAMAALGTGLATLSAWREPLDERPGLGGALRQLGGALGLGDGASPALDAAVQRLGAAVEDETRRATEALIRLHGLAGGATGVVLAGLPAQLDLQRRVDEGPAALLGALLSGAATGLAADVAAGGLTLGGGMLAGGLLGALGAAGAARGLNLVRGTGRSSVGLGAPALAALAEGALLRYLAVAHFGRGRGQWRDGEAPPHWRDAVTQALQPEAEALAAAAGDAAAWQVLLARAATRALDRLYPGAAQNHAA